MWVPGRMGVCLRISACSLAFSTATRMRHIVTSFVAPRSPPHFSKLSHKRCSFRKKVIEHKMCALILSTIFSKSIPILRRITETSSEVSKRLDVKYSLFLSDFNETLTFCTGFRKKLKRQVLLKSVRWETSCCMRTKKRRTDGRT
jgi:hypothetical protein